MARDTQSPALTNLDRAQAPHLASVSQGHARLRRKAVVHTIPITGTPAIGDRHAMVRMNSSDTVVAIYMGCDGAGTAILVNIGLYQARGGAVIDADCFASAVDISTAAVVHGAVNYKYESATAPGAATAILPLWDAHTALTEDPMVQYDIELAETAAITPALTVVSFEVLYIAGD